MMQPQADHGFKPIALMKTNVITNKGYYQAEIKDWELKRVGEKQLLVVHFEVCSGKCEGSKLTAGFYIETPKGIARLSHLCDALGIKGRLENPSQLMGKKVRVRVLPKGTEFYRGKPYRRYAITRFHPLSP